MLDNGGPLILEMDTVTGVQILDEADYISHSTNTLGKGMNPILLPPAMGKIEKQTGFFSLGQCCRWLTYDQNNGLTQRVYQIQN